MLNVFGENQCQVMGNEVLGFRVPRLSARSIVDGISSMRSACDKADARQSVASRSTKRDLDQRKVSNR